MHAKRFARLNQALQQAGFDAIVLNPGPTLNYLTGLTFHLMERPTVLIAAVGKQPQLILAELEMTKARSAPIALDLHPFSDNPSTWVSTFQDAVKSLALSGKKVGVEPARMRLLEMRYIEAALPDAEYIPADEIINSLRMQKDQQEVEMMRQAVKIAQNALLETLPMIRAGVTEREIASELFVQLLRAGSDPELPFQPIVSGGPHSADPHASPGERRLQNGDLVVIDWGAAYQGYISDLTRTFAIGEVEPEYRRIAELVRLANQNGRAAARPGIPAGDVDKAAREVIEAGGYGPQFFHRTGHGIGMEAHEEPYMFGENQMILQPGMTFTVEPGIYLTGRGGVRIEDNVVITENGAETLSDLPRDLITLGKD